MVPWIPGEERLSSSCVLEQPNAALQALPEAAARHERRLEAVSCKALFGEVLAFPSADQRERAGFNATCLLD
jgi:hypothetical protein